MNGLRAVYSRCFLYDQLTKLPNRTLLLSYLSELLQQTQQDQQYNFALLQLDLDRFKLINDGLGYQAGNQLLVTVARRLQQMLRPGDLVAYLGEDEFAILLNNAGNPNEISRLARQIQDTIAKPVAIEDHQIVVTACVGIVLMDKTSPKQLYQQPEEIVRDTDVALHQAKTQGRGQIEFFEIGLRANSVTLLEMERHLRQALARQEFELYYQPLVSLITGRIVGVEALLRWQNPAYAFAPPQDFITLLDDTGLIVPVGVWTLQAVCTQLKGWHEAGYPWLRAAVNLSVCQLRDPNLPVRIESILAETGLAVAALELEITEGSALHEADLSLRNLQQLGNMGLHLSIDDFGMGYSSLDRLKRVPVHTLKIDQSFIRHIYNHDGSDSAIVTTIVTMARRLGLKVIAEGIETPTQLQFLQEQGCDEGQGFLFSPPLPAEAMTRLLQEGRMYG
ncbi:MAG: bifunctional diguanylate cyclase/phosphodiesterase [Anaerolineales bacterium]|nr:bifunctional diguanylate cyclase/phosphodiesterase [Anaerolineales bacterium]